MNTAVIIAAGLVTLPVGFIWYNPKVFGNAWMKTLNITDEEEFKKGANMFKVFGLTILLSLMLAMLMSGIVIHQSGIFSLLQGLNYPADVKIQLTANGNIIDWEHRFRTFGHGAFHGTIAALFIILPAMGINALFERRSFKYVAINVGYWVVCCLLMGGIICAWA